MTEKDMLSVLNGCGAGSLLFIGYEAGGKTTDRAIAEAQRAKEAGFSRQHYTGTLESIRETKSGDRILTVFVAERDSKDGEGAYRSFNPSKGKLRSIEVIEKMPLGAMAL